MAGRKPIYDEKIKPHLGKIKEWSESGVLEKDMYKALGVGKDTWERYKNSKSELKDHIGNGRQFALLELDNKLYRNAMGFEYQESKAYSVVDEQGKRKEHTEIVKKYSPPETRAIHLLKLNWCKGEWFSDPAMFDIKKEELKLRERLAEISEYK